MHTISFREKDNFVHFESLMPGRFFIFKHQMKHETPFTIYLKIGDFQYAEFSGVNEFRTTMLTPQDLEDRDFETLIACDANITILR